MSTLSSGIFDQLKGDDPAQRSAALSQAIQTQIEAAEAEVIRVQVLADSQVAAANAEVERLQTLKALIDKSPDVATALDLLSRGK